MHHKSVQNILKANGNINKLFEKEIKCIEREQEKALKMHVFCTEKIRYQKWKSLCSIRKSIKESKTQEERVTPSPIIVTNRGNTSAEVYCSYSALGDTAELEISRAASFYIIDPSSPNKSREYDPSASLIASCKVPPSLYETTAETPTYETHVARFYQSQINNNSNITSTPILQRNSTQLSTVIRNSKRKLREAKLVKNLRSIPHINKDGRAITTPVTVIGNILEQEQPENSLISISNNFDKGGIRNIDPFPSKLTPRPKVKNSILQLKREIERKRLFLTTLRNRANSRFSYTYRENSRVSKQKKLESMKLIDGIVSDEFEMLSVSDDPDRSDNLTEQSEKLLQKEQLMSETTLFVKESKEYLQKLGRRRERDSSKQELSISAMGQLYYVRKLVDTPDISKHDLYCGCDYYRKH